MSTSESSSRNVGIIRYSARTNSVSSSPMKSFAGARLSYSAGSEPDVKFIALGADEQARDGDDEEKQIDTASEVDEFATGSSSREKSEFRDDVLEESAVAVEEVGTDCVELAQQFAADQPQPGQFVAQTRVQPQLLVERALHLFRRNHTLPFFRLRLFLGALLVIAFFILPSFLSGLLSGVYISLCVFLFACVSDPLPLKHTSANSAAAVPDFAQMLTKVFDGEKHGEKSSKVYKGWMNILDERYSSHSFHVNTIQTVLVRLDGRMLRISRPERALLKHGFHVDPTLTGQEPRILSQQIYDLANAEVKLRPRRLARRRWFSRKYPICIRLARTAVRQPATQFRARNTLTQMEGTGRRVGSMVLDETDQSSSSEEELLDNPIRHSVSEYNVRHGSDSCVPASTSPLLKRRALCRHIYLFARCAREKERWFHKLRQAAQTDSLRKGSRLSSIPSLEQLAEKKGCPASEFALYTLQHFQFAKQLEAIMDEQSASQLEERLGEGGVVAMDLGRNKWARASSDKCNDEFIQLSNLIASRIFYDFCRDDYWCGAVRDKIQTKLATIHLPYWIETLELSQLDLGTATPHIQRVYRPIVDEWGIWCDFEIKYSGMIRLVLETRVNLMKLKSVSESAAGSETNSPKDERAPPFPLSTIRTAPSRYSDEEVPESPETSPDEDFGSKLKLQSGGSGDAVGGPSGGVTRRQKTGQKLLSLVDRIAHSRYFREASELGPIRKVMEEISSTRLQLNVQVTALEGTMTCNFPPPPSDRLWYGFRAPPQMSVQAVPQVGDRSVVLSTLSEWIEGKLQLILEKNLVLPNMDDVIIPVMSGNALLQRDLNK